MTVYQRLKKYLKEKKISQETAAKLNDVSRETISNWLNGRNQIPVNFFIWIKTTFPELNLNWLIVGEGEMELETTTENLEGWQKKMEDDIDKLTEQIEGLYQIITELKK